MSPLALRPIPAPHSEEYGVLSLKDGGSGQARLG